MDKYRHATYRCPECGRKIVRTHHSMCLECYYTRGRNRTKVPLDDPLWHTKRHEENVARLHAQWEQEDNGVHSH